MSRVLLKLKKGDEVKYLSHLDLVRAFELTLRRAGVPVAYSQGFNPRPKMSFGSAVGVGVTSDDERIMLELASPVPPYQVMESLNSSLPPGIRVLDAVEIPDGVKSPISEINASRFRIDLVCDGSCDPSAVEQAIGALFDVSEVVVTRARKDETRTVDIRPNLLGARIIGREGDGISIEADLGFSDSGGATPRDFVQALQTRMSNLSMKRIHRMSQYHADAPSPLGSPARGRDPAKGVEG